MTEATGDGVSGSNDSGASQRNQSPHRYAVSETPVSERRPRQRFRYFLLMGLTFLFAVLHQGDTTRIPETKGSISLSNSTSSKSLSNTWKRPTVERPVYQIDYDLLFWIGKNKICDLVRNITQVSVLGEELPFHLRHSERDIPTPLLNLTLDCVALAERTGNWITAFYAMRLVAALGRVDFQFQCTTGVDDWETNLLVWLTGYYPASRITTGSLNGTTDAWPYDLGRPDESLVCTKKYTKLPLYHLSQVMQRDIRRIAVGLLGPRPQWEASFEVDTTLSLPHWIIPKEIVPRKDLEVDDAAIHFRCGDVFGGTNKNFYGFIPFREYTQRIPRASTKSIGIHTQPFQANLLRPDDQSTTQQCRKVVDLLVEYLQDTYPNATITIRNAINDTLPLTYARLTMAAQTIVSMSTFGIFPAIGTFGEGYFHSNKNQNKFAQRIPEVLPNFHPIEAPIMSSPKVRESSWDDIVNFLTEP